MSFSGRIKGVLGSRISGAFGSSGERGGVPQSSWAPLLPAKEHVVDSVLQTDGKVLTDGRGNTMNTKHNIK